MDVSQFNQLLERTMDTARTKGGGHLSACIAMPASNLIQLYGPLTDKITKDKSVNKAIELYNLYMKKQSGNFLWEAIDRIAIKLGETPIQATNGGVGILDKIIEIQKNSFRGLNAALEEAKIEQTSKLEGFLLAVGDAMFLGAVECVPLAGPLIKNLTNAVASSLITTMLPAATAVATAGASGATTPGNSTNGVATLCVTAIREWNRSRNRDVINNPNIDRPCINVIQKTQTTQNQVASAKVNTLDRARINAYSQKFVGVFPKDAHYDEKSSTIKSFVERTSNLYSGAREMMTSVMNAGIQGSFADQLARLPSDDPRLDDDRKIALLIVGYFFSKDWNRQFENKKENLFKARYGAHGATELGQANAAKMERELELLGDRFERPAFGQKAKPNSLKQWDMKNANDADRIGASAAASLNLARSVSSKKVGAFSGDGLRDGMEFDAKLLIHVEPRTTAYFKAMKAAMVGDIETVLTKSYSGDKLGDAEFKKIWLLYVGAQLIVNHALQEAKVKASASAFGSLLRRLPTKPIDIPRQYVGMIRAAGFIHDYPKGFSLSTTQKIAFAKNNKIRWSDNPSNTERAMLVAFCTIVIYTMDVGRITLGMYNWEAAQANLKNVCRNISEAVIENQA